MQHITDTQGKPLGVFVPIHEWERIQHTIHTSYEDWFHRAVQEGLDSLNAKEYVPDEDIKKLFARRSQCQLNGCGVPAQI